MPVRVPQATKPKKTANPFAKRVKELEQALALAIAQRNELAESFEVLNLQLVRSSEYAAGVGMRLEELETGLFSEVSKINTQLAQLLKRLPDPTQASAS